VKRARKRRDEIALLNTRGKTPKEEDHRKNIAGNGGVANELRLEGKSGGPQYPRYRVRDSITMEKIRGFPKRLFQMLGDHRSPLREGRQGLEWHRCKKSWQIWREVTSIGKTTQGKRKAQGDYLTKLTDLLHEPQDYAVWKPVDEN